MEIGSSLFLGTLVPIEADGTVKLPMDKLETAGIEAGTQVEVFADGAAVYLRTTTQRCSNCGVNSKTQKLGNLDLCERCYNQLMEQAKGAVAQEKAEQQAAKALAELEELRRQRELAKIKEREKQQGGGILR